ncbi:phosphopantothenoylcysteine decarboxylase subunit VHS3 isoform X1 [Ischnura elegans]|uniref:phosphopantothenoylcysteine decarboxylase subunit VHS3 isoform X1 n=1 Tax=Ischnura elegans TaxID=197161 RepID=UPI001ED89134|nr:phosphopantothenoylcysteine decarboxylase subunit VHS3 isoform X1 [Ischnura elegans]
MIPKTLLLEMDDKFLGMPRYSFVEVGGPIRSGFLFLLHLAWESRFRLPILLIVGLMVLDVRMQLEIDFDADLMQDRRNRLVEIIDDEWRNDEDEGDDDDSDEEFEGEVVLDQRNRFVDILDDDWRNDDEDNDSDTDELEIDDDLDTDEDGDLDSVDDEDLTNNSSMTDSYEVGRNEVLLVMRF